MYLIGLDIGTTGAKALLVDERGGVLGKGYLGYKLISDGCRVEQRADDWTECGSNAIRQALEGRDASQVCAVSLSTQGASTVAVDKQNRPVGNAVTWMDSRAKAEAAELANLLGNDYIYRSTGWRVNPSLDAAKILYMKRSGNYNDARYYLSTIEYMNLFLTGNPVCDPTNASIRQLYNVPGGDYDSKILDAIGLSRDELPEIMPTGALVGTITSEAAAATGLLTGTPVYNGAHDQYCASIGAAAVNNGDLLLSAGTTWVVMGIVDKPLFTDTYIAPAVHPVPGLYGTIASLVGSGASLQWFKNNFTDSDFREIDEQAAVRGNKTGELFFYPYLSGAGYPLWNPDVRGSFTGISLAHDKFDFARAIMEASAFSVRQALEDYTANGLMPKTLRIMGGAAKSALWCGLIAAAAGFPVEVSGESEACALGAAIIAAKGFGIYESFRDAANTMTSATRNVAADPGLSETMSERYEEYRRMWSFISGYYANDDRVNQFENS